MTSLAQLLGATRVLPLREAIVATLAPRFADVDVRAHLGRLDMADVEAGDVFSTPSLNVAVTRIGAAEGRMNGQRDVPVEVAIYVVTRDQPVANGRTSLRDEIAIALCDGVLDVVEDPDIARWGLDEIAPPEMAEARPLFTARSRQDGTSYYVVTWRQMLYGAGRPFADLDSVAAAADVLALLPGDPGWTPPLPHGSAP